MRAPRTTLILAAALGASIGGCYHQEYSVTPARAEARFRNGRAQGERGFGTRETVDGLYLVFVWSETRVTRVGNAAVTLPPDAPLGAADLVWRSSDAGLHLCRVENGEAAACLAARYAESRQPVEPRAMFLDPVNHGSVRVISRTSGGGRGGHTSTTVVGSVEPDVRAPATLSGGVWTLASQLAYCDVEGPDRAPVCRTAPVDAPWAMRASVLAVHVIRRNGVLHDVVWVQTDRGVTRCEAGPDAPTPSCTRASVPG